MIISHIINYSYIQTNILMGKINEMNVYNYNDLILSTKYGKKNFYLKVIKKCLIKLKKKHMLNLQIIFIHLGNTFIKNTNYSLE